MTRKDEILARLDALIEKADKALQTHTPNPANVIGFPTLQFEIFSEWQTQSIAFLSNLLGLDHIYVQNFKDRVKEAYTGNVSIGKGILKGVREDVEGGYLQKIEALVSADIFSDFLDMAEYLLNEGYKDPAASLVGAVLEDGLRKMCASHNVAARSREDISSLNQKLADKQIYNRLTQKKLQVWNDVRNNADHGHFGEYDLNDVKDMLRGVHDFLEQFL